MSDEDRDESKLDLRSRGLCLVPLSCTSYVTSDNGGVWSPPNYGGNVWIKYVAKKSCTCFKARDHMLVNWRMIHSLYFFIYIDQL